MRGTRCKWHPLVGWFLSLIGHSKQLKQLCIYLIGWGLFSCLSWLGIVHKCVTKFSLVWSFAKMSQPCICQTFFGFFLKASLMYSQLSTIGASVYDRPLGLRLVWFWTRAAGVSFYGKEMWGWIQAFKFIGLSLQVILTHNWLEYQNKNSFEVPLVV